MTTVEIPLRPKSERFGIALAGATYTLTVVWRASAWVMDIATVNGAAIVSGIPLVTGTDLLGAYPDLMIGGGMFVTTDHDTDAVPSYSGLGSSSHLYFVSRDASPMAGTQVVVLSPSVEAAITAYVNALTSNLTYALATARVTEGSPVAFTPGGGPNDTVNNVTLPAGVVAMPSFQLYLGGVRQVAGAAYTQSGNVLTFPNGVPGDADFLAVPVTVSFG